MREQVQRRVSVVWLEKKRFLIQSYPEGLSHSWWGGEYHCPQQRKFLLYCLYFWRKSEFVIRLDKDR